jgi:hypothetical protein
MGWPARSNACTSVGGVDLKFGDGSPRPQLLLALFDETTPFSPTHPGRSFVMAVEN